jgi:biopolymer transport protein ExbD
MRWGKMDKAMNLRSPNREEPEINLTSLIDVVLLLLVFFMITTSFVRESKIGIRLPEASSTEESVAIEEPMTISVTAQGTYLVNGRSLLDNRPETLESAIRVLAGEDLGGRVTVSADAEASHQAVITAMDVAGRLGYVEINIATTKPGTTE